MFFELFWPIFGFLKDLIPSILRLIAPTPKKALLVLEFDIYYKTIPGDTESKIAAAKHSIEVKENSHLGKKKLLKQFNTFFYLRIGFNIVRWFVHFRFYSIGNQITHSESFFATLSQIFLIQFNSQINL